jgi:transposase
MKRLLPARPPHPVGCHNPRVPDRDAMSAILFVRRTGCQWNALAGRAGEPLRALACDYGVAHTTLGRYFKRPDVKAQLRQALQQLRAEQRALVVRRG